MHNKYISIYTNNGESSEGNLKTKCTNASKINSTAYTSVHLLQGYT